jgi:2'-5' RNA ligase
MQNTQYDYSSTQVNLPETLAQEIIAWGKKHVSDHDLYVVPGESNYGREDEPHVTILYGIHDDHHKEVADLVKGYGEAKIKLGEMSIFTGEKYDVLIIKIVSEDLVKLRKTLTDNVEYTSDHPKYQPHVTIAYVKKGRGWKHYNNAWFAHEQFKTNKIVFSSHAGSKHQISL